MQKKFVVVMMFANIFLSAMDRPQSQKVVHLCSDLCISAAHDKIDEELLGVKKDVWFKPIRGTCASIWESAQSNGDESQTRRRLFEIDETISARCRNSNMFTALQKKHWYVSYIVTNMIGRRVEQLKKVTGSQVSRLLSENPIIDRDFSPQMNKWIHLQAKNQYMQDMGYSDDLKKIPFGSVNEDIHYTRLLGAISPIQKIHVHLTRDGDDYIEGITEEDNQLIWSVKNGNKCEVIPPQTGVRACYMNECITTNDHHIIFGYVRSKCTDKIMRILGCKYGYKEIVVFAKPTFESYICQQAFKNSKNDKKELGKLQEFARITDLLKGFVKNNVLNMICARLLKSDVDVKEVY